MKKYQLIIILIYTTISFSFSKPYLRLTKGFEYKKGDIVSLFYKDYKMAIVKPVKIVDIKFNKINYYICKSYKTGELLKYPINESHMQLVILK